MGFLTRFMVFVIVLVIFIVTVSVAALVGTQLWADYGTYKALGTTTCESFVADLKGPEPARAAAAVELFNAPGGNLFVKLYQPNLRAMPPKFTEVLATCAKLPQLTLLGALQNAASTGVDARIKQLLVSQGMMADPMTTPEHLQKELAEYNEALKATEVSATAAMAPSPTEPSPTQPQPAAPAHPAKKK